MPPPTLTSEQITQLKNRLATLLRDSNTRPTTKEGRKCIQMFWLGAMHTASALDVAPTPYPVVLLAAGRYDELVGTPDPLLPVHTQRHGN